MWHLIQPIPLHKWKDQMTLIQEERERSLSRLELAVFEDKTKTSSGSGLDGMEEVSANP